MTVKRAKNGAALPVAAQCERGLIKPAMEFVTYQSVFENKKSDTFCLKDGIELKINFSILIILTNELTNPPKELLNKKKLRTMD